MLAQTCMVSVQVTLSSKRVRRIVKQARQKWLEGHVASIAKAAHNGDLKPLFQFSLNSPKLVPVLRHHSDDDSAHAEERRKEGEAFMPIANQGKLEDKSADAEKKAEIEEKKSEWKGMIQQILANFDNDMVRSSGQEDG